MSELSRSSQTTKSTIRQTPVKQVGKRLLTMMLVLLLVGVWGVTAVYAAPPVIQPGQSFTVLENSATGTVVGTVATTGDPVTAFSILAGNTGDAFSINPATGQITVLTGTAVDYETTPVFTLLISAANADGSTQEVVTINVVDVNDPPEFTNLPYDFDFAENNNVGDTVGVITATDPDGDNVTYSILQWIIATGPFTLDAGSGELTANVSLDYETDQTTYIFIVQASDGGRSSTALVTINLQDANDAPVANDDTDAAYTIGQNESLIITTPTVLDNDTDEDGDDLTAVLETQPVNGSVTLNLDGTFTYDPNPGFNGLDTFTYRAQDDGDGNLLSNIATVTITVTGDNDAPTAVDDPNYTTPEDTALTVNAPGVMENDTDPENDNLIATRVLDVSNGTLDFSADGSFVYTPDPNFNGIDTFTYFVTDDGTPQLSSDAATVTITVTPVNDAPEVNDATWSVDENALADTLVGALTVTDPDGDTAFTFDITAGNTNNAFLLNSAGELRVNSSSALDFETTPVFTLTVAATDDGGLTGQATVVVTLNDVNEAPTAVDDPNYTTAEDTPLVVNIPGVLGNDTDPDGDSLLAYLDSSPSSGVVTLNTDGSFVYTPTLDFFGVDTFTYFVVDSGSPQLSSDAATVTITVTSVNDAPVAVDDPENSGDYDTPEDTQLAILATNGVLANDFDVDGDGLTAVLVTDVSSGVLELNEDGSFTYMPAGDFFGEDTFTYRAQDDGDGNLLSNTATVTITVTPVNDAPVINDQSFTIDENSAVGTPVGTVAASDVDNPPSDLTFAITPGGSGDGSFGIDANSGEISVIDSTALDMETTQSFTLTVEVSDTEPLTETAVITINLNNVNEYTPTITAGQIFTISEAALNNTTVGTVEADDEDYGESVIAFAITGGNADGIFAINNSGVIRVADNANLDFETTDLYTLDIEVTDNGSNPGARTGAGQVVVHITDANDAPIITDLTVDPISIDEGDSVDLDGSFTDQDAADAHTVTINWGDGSVNTIINPAAGVYTFTTSHTYADDPAGLPDEYTIQVTVSDGSANDVDTATVTVANVAPTLSNVAIAPTTTDEGSSATLSGDISDPGVQDAFTLVVTWGDGQSSTYNYPAGTTTFSESHTFADDGQPLTVALTLTDNDGGQDTDSVTITVNNLPPAADAGPDQTVNVGETVNFDASGTTDPGSADTHTFDWDFGDGAAGTGVTPSHVYTAIGVYTATLTVTDDDGGEDTDEVVITVVSPSDLAATKTVSGDFAEGGTIFYTIAITNSGSTQLDNPGDELVDVLPAQLALVEAQVVSGGGAVNANLPANTVTWNGSIASGGSVVLSIEATILAGHKGEQVSNQATLHYDADGNGSNEATTYTDDPTVDGSYDPTVFTIQNEYFVFMPVILNNYVSAPDLVVTDVQASSSFIQVVIKNQGNAPVVESFWIDFYINPNPVPTMANELWPEVAAEGLAWGFTDMLAPGEVLTLTYSTAPGAANDYFVAEESLYNGTLPVGTPVYAQVDSAHAGIPTGAVLELDELPGGVYNNIYGTTATAVSPLSTPSASANGAGQVNLVNVLLLPFRR